MISNKIKNKFRSEIVSVTALFIIFIVIMKITLYKENIFILFLVVLKFFYSIIIPGLFILLHLNKKLGFTSRLILGSVLVIALTSITSYYMGLAGLHVKYHPYAIPPLIVVLGLFLFLKNGEK